MINNYPTYIDDFNLKQTREEKNAVEVMQRLQPLDILYAIQALENKMGSDSSTDTTSLDYKVSALTTLVAKLIANEKHIERGIVSLTADVEAMITFKQEFDLPTYAFTFRCYDVSDSGTVGVYYLTKASKYFLIKSQGDCTCEYIAIY